MDWYIDSPSVNQEKTEIQHSCTPPVYSVPGIDTLKEDSLTDARLCMDVDPTTCIRDENSMNRDIFIETRPETHCERPVVPASDAVPMGRAEGGCSNFSKAQTQCIYDEIFSGDPITTVAAVDCCFDACMTFSRRHTGPLWSVTDNENADRIATCGDPQSKLLFVIMAMAHDGALKEQVSASCDNQCGREQDAERISAMHRMAAIATRSALESPFNESNADEFARRFIYLCVTAWRVLRSADRINNFCDFFGARLPVIDEKCGKQVQRDAMIIEMATTEQLEQISAAVNMSATAQKTSDASYFNTVFAGLNRPGGGRNRMSGVRIV